MMQDFVQAILKTQSSYRQIMQRKMRENNIDLTFEMLHIIKCLRNNGGVNQQELANLVYKDKSSLSYLIKNMERRGFVVRREDVNDKRSKLVILTADGLSLYYKVIGVIDDVYAKIESETNAEHLRLCVEYMNEFNDMVK